MGRTYDKLGYVRATVPTAKADAAIKAASKLSSVHGIDLRQEIALDDPTPSADTAKGAKKAPTAAAYPAPGKNTPAENPYNPSFETGAVDFVKKNPKADGRGITIGILDSGVDLAHPALQKTTTGERKIVDWVTSTDPIIDGDATWRAMLTLRVRARPSPSSGKTWKAPGGQLPGQPLPRVRDRRRRRGRRREPRRRHHRRLGRALRRRGRHGPRRPERQQRLHRRRADEAVQGRLPDRLLRYRQPGDRRRRAACRSSWRSARTSRWTRWAATGSARSADFVNIGIIESEHGTHVAGITAANGLFGGKMNGAAPGAKLVSSRACTLRPGGCTNVALTEGMIDLVANRGVDIVNMSIGGLPALNDGNNARAELYTRLIDTYGVQLVISAGNSGPGANTIGDPGLADKVISVGASISKETWASNYGSQVSRRSTRCCPSPRAARVRTAASRRR